MDDTSDVTICVDGPKMLERFSKLKRAADATIKTPKGVKIIADKAVSGQKLSQTAPVNRFGTSASALTLMNAHF